ncbi:MAG TPA: nuclear transport factor 2 family protein [Ilumatobacteraceae bacterium]
MTAAQPPAQSTVQIDNEHVRVTEWRFTPGAETGEHHHQMDYVVVPLVGGKLRVDMADGSSSEHELRAGSSYNRAAGARHNVINANDFDFAFVEVELKPAGADLSERRAAVVRQHMESENAQQFDATIATFRHPRYELIANGMVYDGEEEVRQYFTAGRAVVPDQRNELIALHSAGNAVIAEFWLLGTVAGRLSDHTFRARMCAIFEFEAGGDRVVCERVYWDRQTISDQITAT